MSGVRCQEMSAAEKRLRELAIWVGAVVQQLEATPRPGTPETYEINKVIANAIAGGRAWEHQLRAEGLLK